MAVCSTSIGKHSHEHASSSSRTSIGSEDQPCFPGLVALVFCSFVSISPSLCRVDEQSIAFLEDGQQTQLPFQNPRVFTICVTHNGRAQRQGRPRRARNLGRPVELEAHRKSILQPFPFFEFLSGYRSFVKALYNIVATRFRDECSSKSAVSFRKA